MNLYHCTTVFQILEMIVHKERVHPGEYNVLLLADFTAKTYPNYRELEGFFDEVLLFPYRSISNNPDRILEDVETAYRDTVPYDPSEFENIYVAAAFYYFSLYLIARRIPFHMFEDGGGILTKPKVLYDSIHNVTPVMADIAETYGLLDGRNEYASDVICSFAAQSFLPDDPKWRDFDPASEIRHLSPETVSRILHFFRLEPIRDIPENAALIFTQQFSSLFTVTRQEQVAIYQVCADFFLRGQHLILKPHPSDPIDYTPYFPEVKMLRGRFPAELLPALLNRVPETSLTVSSSSVRNLRRIFQKNIVCGFDFPETYRAIDRYYFAVKLLKETDALKDCPVHTFGVDVCMLEAIAEHALNARLPFVHETALKKETDGRQVWLIDDSSFMSDYFRTKEKELSFAYRRVTVKGVEPPASPAPEAEQREDAAPESPARPERMTDALSMPAFLDALGEEDLVVFLNSRDETWFAEEGQEERLMQMTPLLISKRKTREENVFFPDQDGILFAYTRDARLREKLQRFHAEITLENTGLAEEIRGLNLRQLESILSQMKRSANPESVSIPPETRIPWEEYLNRAMDLNDTSMKLFLHDKINLFLRPGLREMMGRPALEVSSAADDEICRFLQTWVKAVGKRNDCAGEGFQVYTDSETDALARIRAEGADILEPWIRQHQGYEAIYPDSLNTIRIHTVRSSQGVKVFLPSMLAVGGDGAVNDNSTNSTRYRVMLSEDGEILQAFRENPAENIFQPAERHHNTGYLFLKGRKLPRLPVCLELCRKAAFYVPELRYIGWDVAVTEKGPVFVEANNLSGTVNTIQRIWERVNGAGARKAVEELLAYGMEGVRYQQETVYVSEPLVTVDPSLPDCRRLYLILLQSALHRHGVEFYDRPTIGTEAAVKKRCSIRYLEEENAVLLEAEGRTARIPQPDLKALGLTPYRTDGEKTEVSEEDFLKLDQTAMQQAEQIYRILTEKK
ncbi:MAG: hypothetical protein J6S60_08695 [Oscillospiraceae bacterium]|nr:hypothetical protein [Oscillospiraceae bacterium]